MSSGVQFGRLATAAVAAGLAVMVGCSGSDTDNAIRTHDHAALTEQLKKPGAIEERDGHGMTPLIYAAREGNVDAVRTLLERGANVNAVDDKGNTALIYSADHNSAPVAQLLLDKGADVNVVNQRGHTALAYAEDSHYSTLIDLLKSHGAK